MLEDGSLSVVSVAAHPVGFFAGPFVIQGGRGEMYEGELGKIKVRIESLADYSIRLAETPQSSSLTL